MSRPNSPAKVATRSAAKSRGSERTPASRSKAARADSLTPPRSTSRSVKLADRKFFTVAEDLLLLDQFKKLQAHESLCQIAQKLARQTGHSEESVRDRIRRVLSKLRQVDHRLLAEEAKVAVADQARPRHFAHFTKENQRGRRTITHFTAGPPKVAGSSLTGGERRAMMREHRRQKSLVARADQKAKALRVSATGRRERLEEVYTTDELFKIRDELEHRAKEASQFYCSRLRKRRPEQTSRSVSRSRKTSADLDSVLDEEKPHRSSSLC